MPIKLQQKKYTFDLPYKNMHIKVLSDLHFCPTLQKEKLDYIKKTLTEEKVDYLCIPGDLIDSTNFIYENPDKSEELIQWMENISKYKKTFITLGNHDITTIKANSSVKDWNASFWKEVSSIPNVQVSYFNPYYEDENIIIYMLDLSYEYYYNESGQEDKEMLITQLKAYKRLLTDLDKSKLKIIMTHSPFHMTDPEVIQLINEFDFIITGHMHNGLVPPIIDRIIPGNKGIIAPNKTMFPDNARGIKMIPYQQGNKHLIISGGITKLSEASKIRLLNDVFFPMSIDDIEIKHKTLNLHK